VLAGEFHHQSLTPQGKPCPDDNHTYLWIKVPGGGDGPGGVYECAFNIHSSRGALVRFAELEEELEEADPPDPGFTPTELSYGELGLTDEDFAPVREGDLHVLVTQYAERCDRMAAYGVTYDDGTGMHDLHMRNRSPRRRRGSRRRPTGAERDRRDDGALVFYFHRQTTPRWVARWVCVKFADQCLGPDGVTG
jgi:hypothetical protein